MREIVILIKNNQITASTDFAGYVGEHNATALRFELAPELESPNYTYKVNITLPDEITASIQLTDMSLALTSTLTASEGIIQVQLVITEAGSLIYKSGITKLKIKPSLEPTTIFGSGTSIENIVVNDEGNLIVTLSDGKEINAGYVKGEKGDNGDTYTLSDTDKQEVADKLSYDIIRGIIEHNITALEIPEGTTQISNYQFKDNDELRRVVVPDSLEVIGEEAFKNCFRMTGIDGMKGLKEIGNYAFVDCCSLTDIKFPETLEFIKLRAFQNCKSLRNKDLILPNCKEIWTEAFSGCAFTGRLELPNCKELTSGAFNGSNFSSLVLSSALTTYNPSVHALITCTNLEFVDLGTDFNCNNFILSMSTKYSVETLVSVLNSLKDRTGETAYNLTLGATNLAKLTDEQKAIATNKNWVLK